MALSTRSRRSHLPKADGQAHALNGHSDLNEIAAFGLEAGQTVKTLYLACHCGISLPQLRDRVERVSCAHQFPVFLSNSLTYSRDRGNKNAVVFPKIGADWLFDLSGNQNFFVFLEIGTDGYFDHTGCLGMARLPFTIGGKSFTSSYTSVMKRSVLACESPWVVLSYGSVRCAASTSFSDLP